MTTYRIKQGESLKVKYQVDGVEDLSDYSCSLFLRKGTDQYSVCSMTMTDDNSAFIGNIPSEVTQGLIPGIWWVVVVIWNVVFGGDVPDESGRFFEIHDKLIIEQSMYIVG